VIEESPERLDESTPPLVWHERNLNQKARIKKSQHMHGVGKHRPHRPQNFWSDGEGWMAVNFSSSLSRYQSLTL